MKILIVINTHSGYLSILDKVQEGINQLVIPEGIRTDTIVIKGEPFKGFPQEDNKVSKFSEDHLQQLVNTRNDYLKKAGGYDYVLHVDGDIVPPKDGLIKLLNSGKKYIGGWAYNKKSVGKYVVPDKIKGDLIYDCEVIGNMFLLEHRDMFKIKYRLFDDRMNVGESLARCYDVRVRGGSCWVHSGVKCDHLLSNGEIYKP